MVSYSDCSFTILSTSQPSSVRLKQDVTMAGKQGEMRSDTALPWARRLTLSFTSGHGPPRARLSAPHLFPLSRSSAKEMSPVMRQSTEKGAGGVTSLSSLLTMRHRPPHRRFPPPKADGICPFFPLCGKGNKHKHGRVARLKPATAETVQHYRPSLPDTNTNRVMGPLTHRRVGSAWTGRPCTARSSPR
jgi:hypothetical protein